jgi:hypothetical protein
MRKQDVDGKGKFEKDVREKDMNRLKWIKRGFCSGLF